MLRKKAFVPTFPPLFFCIPKNNAAEDDYTTTAICIVAGSILWLGWAGEGPIIFTMMLLVSKIDSLNW